MKGIDLRSLKGELYLVDPQFDRKPSLAITAIDAKLKSVRAEIESVFGSFSFLDHYHYLPLRWLVGFTFDDICKLKFSTGISMDGSVQDLFKQRPNYETVRKVASSTWRWDCSARSWNALVEVWNAVRSFDLGLGGDFEVRLDYTTGYNAYGYSKFSRTYLDGVFAYLVYYKGKHVMTIGFSPTEGKRVFIQQVQLKQQNGNRWLYKFPANRLEFVIGLFAKHFPGFALYVIDGESLADNTLSDYQRALGDAQESLERAKERREDDADLFAVVVQMYEDEVGTLLQRIAHLKSDAPRLARFYASCGRYVLSRPTTVNRLIHYEVEL